MTEVTWGIMLFAGLMAVYTLGWLAGHEHAIRWTIKEPDTKGETDGIEE